jgi:hypothetical protein
MDDHWEKEQRLDEEESVGNRKRVEQKNYRED